MVYDLVLTIYDVRFMIYYWWSIINDNFYDLWRPPQWFPNSTRLTRFKDDLFASSYDISLSFTFFYPSSLSLWPERNFLL